MYWLLQEEPSTTHECPFPTIQTIIESSSSAEEVLRKIQLNPEQILLISKTTELQRECPAWHGMRLGRLTASNFGPVIHALETNK